MLECPPELRRPKIEGPAWFSTHVLPDGKTILKVGDDIGCFGGSVADVLASLDGASDVELVINSRGGDSQIALELAKALKGRVSRCVATGNLWSAGLILALAASDRIEVAANTSIMAHRPCLWVYGDNSELERAKKSLEKTTAQFKAVLVTKTGNAELAESLLDGHDHYMTAPEAVRLKLVDSVFELPAQTAADSPEDVGREQCETEGQKLFMEFLRLLGPLTVQSKAEFCRALNAWLVHKVTELG